jgi:nitrogen fixation protein FixH
MNWGKSIALVYAIFVFAMLGAVFASRRHDPGLVAKDYYALDLQYESRMEAKRNAAALPTAFSARYVPEQAALRCTFPREAGTITGGQLRLLRGSTARDDLSLSISADSLYQMIVPVEKLPRGRWRLEAEWQARGQTFYHEMPVFIP